MKTKRNALSTLAVFLITVSIVLTSSSCFTNDLAGHKHSYTAKVIEATCLSDGCTEYTCSCGDSYRENETGKGPHRNTTTYEYPTVDKAGKKTSVCSVCGHSETVTLDAMSVSSPKIAEFVIALIGSVEYSLRLSRTQPCAQTYSDTAFSRDGRCHPRGGRLHPRLFTRSGGYRNNRRYPYAHEHQYALLHRRRRYCPLCSRYRSRDPETQTCHQRCLYSQNRR